jgi:hypothetical protein
MKCRGLLAGWGVRGYYGVRCLRGCGFWRRLAFAGLFCVFVGWLWEYDCVNDYFLDFVHD